MALTHLDISLSSFQISNSPGIYMHNFVPHTPLSLTVLQFIEFPSILLRNCLGESLGMSEESQEGLGCNHLLLILVEIVCN